MDSSLKIIIKCFVGEFTVCSCKDGFARQKRTDGLLPDERRGTYVPQNLGGKRKMTTVPRGEKELAGAPSCSEGGESSKSQQTKSSEERLPRQETQQNPFQLDKELFRFLGKRIGEIAFLLSHFGFPKLSRWGESLFLLASLRPRRPPSNYLNDEETPLAAAAAA